MPWIRFSLTIALTVVTVPFVHAQIIRWDSQQVIPGTERITLRPGIDLSSWNSESRNLRYATFSEDLANANFNASWLDFAHFRRANVSSADFVDAILTRTDFRWATLTNADLTGAIIERALFEDATSRGFTKEQLYSTASYQQKKLREILLRSSDLSDWDFRGQELTDSDFYQSSLTDADFTGAIILGALFERSAGLTKEQIYSTASYQQQDLRGIGLPRNDLSDWDFSGQNLVDASFTQATLSDANLRDAIVTNVSFSSTTSLGFTKDQLYSTANYQAKDLQGIGLYNNDVSGWDFSGQDLSHASFSQSNVADADFTGAIVEGTSFERTQGFMMEQLYSTYSYQQKDLGGISVSHNDVSGWDFSGQYLINADFDDATYMNTDLTGADLRGGQFFELPMAITRNTIFPDGSIAGLILNDADRLVIRNDTGQYQPPIPVTIFDRMTMAESSILQLQFDEDEWNSSVSFAYSIPVDLGGALELVFVEGVDVASQVGRTFAAFDWTEVSPTGQFRIDSAYFWDETRLYTTGEVTLLAVPEPSSTLLLFVAMLPAIAMRSLRD